MPEELKNNAPTFTWGFWVAILAIVFTAGVNWSTYQQMIVQIENLKAQQREIKEFLNEEDDGVRSDFEKEDKNIKEQIRLLWVKSNQIEEELHHGL